MGAKDWYLGPAFGCSSIDKCTEAEYLKLKRFFAALVALVGVGVCREGVGQPLDGLNNPPFFAPFEAVAQANGVALSSGLNQQGCFNYAARGGGAIVFAIDLERELHLQALQNFQDSL